MPARVLIEEVEKRTRIRWKSGDSGSPSIVIRNAGAGAPEGFSIATSGSTVTVTGNDARGTLFGVGYLLRQLRWSRDSISAPDNLAITTAPKVALRGHQLGYRPKPNSYDGWTAAMWDQYIRELALFGTNAIELIPPRSDDDPDSPHFPVAQMPMMIEMSRIIDSYGLDCWVWYPALDDDYSKPEQVEFALKEWGEVLRQLPRVDAVFVPGGDPGHTPPKVLMPFLEKQAANLRKYHPKAQMWVAPQGFTKAWMDDFFETLRAEPKWLTGIVYGPQSRMTIHELRAAIPKGYPLRHYPDITHTLNSQFPVPDWDFALARTHHREPINPRPVDQAIIFKHTNPATVGFLTYSEGCNDDVNKFVWSALGWNPDASLDVALRDYGRLFFGPDHADAIAHLIFALERNWRGPLHTNGDVAVTLAQAQALERAASPQLRLNWRFQQLLYRAYYDAYVRARWFHESGAEDWSYDKLRRAPETGSLAAMAAAESILDNAANEPVAIDLRQRVYSLAEALYQSIRMQLSVAMYQGEAGRGNTLDSVEAPLNNRAWLKAQFTRIRKMEKESDRLAELRNVVEWENPGPGGFYDDLGNPTRQTHLVRTMAYADDPSGLKSPIAAFGTNMASAPWRTSWITDAQAYYDSTLIMRYTGLDPSARYRLEVVDGSIGSETFEMRLVADDRIEVHGWRKKQPGERLRFAIPQAATASGELKLTWHPTLGRGGAGRGLQLAEVWLIREEPQ
jgi:hypothetical protein